MQQIADWLNALGMSEYAQRFAENRIDLSVLPDLTDQDLKDLGIVLGDRRKMLRAIAALDGGASAAAHAKPAAPAGTPAAAPSMYATKQERPGMNRWRSVCPIACRTRSDMPCGPKTPASDRA